MTLTTNTKEIPDFNSFFSDPMGSDEFYRIALIDHADADYINRRFLVIHVCSIMATHVVIEYVRYEPDQNWSNNGLYDFGCGHGNMIEFLSLKTGVPAYGPEYPKREGEK